MMNEHVDTWDKLKKDLKTAVMASCKPSAEFRYPAPDEIIPVPNTGAASKANDRNQIVPPIAGIMLGAQIIALALKRRPQGVGFN